jgi:hypothetical protein
MTIKQISIFVENHPGKLAEITQAIGEAGVDIRALSLADTSDFGILRLIVDKPEAAVEALRAKEIATTLTEVIAVALDDKPGALGHVIEILGGTGINVEYMYAFLARQEARAFVILRVEAIEDAIRALTGQGVRLLTEGEIYSM